MSRTGPRPSRVFVTSWHEGRMWVRTELFMPMESMEIVVAVWDMIKTIAQDDDISLSKAVEFMAADFAATYNVPLSEDDVQVTTAELVDHLLDAVERTQGMDAGVHLRRRLEERRG